MLTHNPTHISKPFASISIRKRSKKRMNNQTMTSGESCCGLTPASAAKVGFRGVMEWPPHSHRQSLSNMRSSSCCPPRAQVENEKAHHASHQLKEAQRATKK